MKFPLGALVGVVAGVVAGILTAPKSGKETRADIKHKAEELKEGAEKTAGKVVDEAKHTVEDLKAKVKKDDKKK